MNVPEILLDSDGYPTQEYLDWIENYKYTDMPIMDFIDNLEWYFDDWGFILKRKYNGRRKLELHTGGWSGNEEIIRAITGNIHLTAFKMKYVMWRTGGHYYFELIID